MRTGTPRNDDIVGWWSGKPYAAGCSLMSCRRSGCGWSISRPSTPCPRGRWPISATSPSGMPWWTKVRSRRSGAGDSTPSAAYLASTSSPAIATMRCRTPSRLRSAAIVTTASSSNRCRSSRACSPTSPLRGQASAGGSLGVLGREDRGLRAAGQTQLGEHRGRVVLDGLLGEVHALGDLPVGQALADQVEDPLLLVGELRQLLVHGRPVADPVEHLRR